MEENQAHIPDGWELESLGKVVSFSTGKKDVNQGNPEGDYPFFTCSKTFTFSDEYSFDEEALMVAGNGDVGTVHYYNGKFEAYQRTYVLINLKLDVQFLFQLLKSELIPYLLSGQSGTTIQFIKIGQLTGFQFLKPKSKPEQTQIAAILSKVDEAITQTEQLIAKYTRIKTGLMQDLLIKGIDENGNIRSEETHEFKDSPLGKIPKEWECVDITKFTKNYDNAVKPGPFGSSVKKEFYTKTGYKIYGQEQVIANDPFVGDYYIDEKRYKSLYGFKVDSGDVLLSCVGTIGSVLIIPKNFEEGIINPRLIKFSLDSKKTNIHFFAEYLKHNSINTQLINLATGGTMPVLNKKIVLSLQFIYPKIDEQDRINEKWQIISNHLKNEELKLSKLKSLKIGLMQDLLSGKVSVNRLIKETTNV